MPAVRLAHVTGVLAYRFRHRDRLLQRWLILASRMPKGSMPKRAGRRRAEGKRKVRVPRSVGSAGTVVSIRRVYDAGTVVKALGDGGGQWGTVPSNLSDWASFQATFARYRLLRVTNVYMVSGEFDATPAFPTLWVYHDYMSTGAPANLSQAFLKQGVKSLSFNATTQRRSFTYVPMVWTSSGFQTQVPAPQLYAQTAAAFAPSFSSVGYWAQNYNTTTAACNIMLLQEMLLEFSLPV